MNEPVVSVDSNRTVLAAGEEMVASHVGHLALVDADGMNGVISARAIWPVSSMKSKRLTLTRARCSDNRPDFIFIPGRFDVINSRA
jgi:hypothetical protein